MYYAIYETNTQISLYTWAVGMVGDLITNFNSSYENEFSFEPGRGHVNGRLCIRLVVLLILCILSCFSILET